MCLRWRTKKCYVRKHVKVILASIRTATDDSNDIFCSKLSETGNLSPACIALEFNGIKGFPLTNWRYWRKQCCLLAEANQFGLHKFVSIHVWLTIEFHFKIAYKTSLVLCCTIPCFDIIILGQTVFAAI